MLRRSTRKHLAASVAVLPFIQGSAAFHTSTARIFTPSAASAAISGLPAAPPSLRATPRARLAPSGVRGLAAAIADRGWAINNNANVFTPAPAVKISGSSAAPEAWEGDLLLVPLMMAEGEDKKALAPVEGAAAAIDKATEGAINELVADNEFKGGPGSSATVRMGGASKVKKLCILGAGAHGWRKQ